MFSVVLSTIRAAELEPCSSSNLCNSARPQRFVESISKDDVFTMDYEIIINVSDYDGESDTERIQKALDDVPPEGATVFLPKGVWEACNLTAKSGTRFTGTNETILRRPFNTTVHFIKFENESRFSIVNMIFEGQNVSEATGILILNSSQFQIINNTFADISVNAVRITGFCENFRIEDNKLTRCDIAPIILFGSPGERLITNFTIAHNLLINGTDNGKIGIAFAADGTIANNTVKDCEYGIATRGVSQIVIISNHIENCLSYAIYLGTQPADPGSTNIEITQNYIADCSVGISRWYGSQPIHNVTLTENTLVYNEEWDIYADFPATFINNTITSAVKLRIINANVEFKGNTNATGHPIMPGDMNDDLRIDMKDIGPTAILFGCTPSSEKWNPLADIIADNIIDMKDIAFRATRFWSEW